MLKGFFQRLKHFQWLTRDSLCWNHGVAHLNGPITPRTLRVHDARDKECRQLDVAATSLVKTTAVKSAEVSVPYQYKCADCGDVFEREIGTTAQRALALHRYALHNKATSFAEAQSMLLQPVETIKEEVQHVPGDAGERKRTPIATGLVDYFPDALVAVARVSFAGNEQHNPGKPLHWDRTKSQDEADTLMRHFIDRGKFDKDGQRHSAKVAWRALALLQKELEADRENASNNGS